MASTVFKKDLYVYVVLLAVVCWTRVSSQENCKSTPTDIVFALDCSTSLTEEEFEIMKNFTNSLIDLFPKVGANDGTLTALIRFSTYSDVMFNLTQYSTKLEIKAAVTAVTYLGGITNTHLALRDMYKLMVKGRQGVKKVGILITDGNADKLDLTTQEATKLKNAGYILIVVGIGTTLNKTILIKLASRENLYIQVDRFTDLSKFTENVFEVVCEPLTKVCQRCQYINGVYFFADLANCYRYYLCTYPEQIKPLILTCPIGQFWHQDTLTCQPSNRITCPSDPCKNTAIRSYKHHSICAGYWVCSGGKTSDLKCCSKGFEYRQGRCVPNAQCKDDCSEPTVKPVPCDKKAHGTDSNKYLQNVGGDVWVTMDCAYGTQFHSGDCKCSIHRLTPSKPACKDTLHIAFDTNSKDTGRRVYVKNVGRVKTLRRNVPAGFTGRGAGMFSGSSKLYILMFANSYFGNKLTIRLRFLELPRATPVPSGKCETLFSNGDCGKDASINLKYDRNNNAVIATLVTSAGTVTATAHAPPGVWKEVEFTYDGKNLKLTVEKVEIKTPTHGNIETRKAALQIGAGCGDINYKGYIDDFIVYKCLP